MTTKQKKIILICSKIIFGIYLVFLIYFLFFAESTGRTFTDRAYHYNLILLKEIKRFIRYHHILGTTAVSLNLVGNIIAFFPFGAIMPIFNKRLRNFLLMLFLTFEFSLVVEILQLISKVGSFDVDDLLLNTIGGMAGYLCFYIMNKIRRYQDGT